MKKSQKKISTDKIVEKCRKIIYARSYTHYPPKKQQKRSQFYGNYQNIRFVYYVEFVENCEKKQ